MTRSIYGLIVLIFIGFTGQFLVVLEGYHPLADRGLLRFGSENAMLLAFAIGIFTAWLRATFLRIRDMGVQRSPAYLLCAGALAFCVGAGWIWISASHKWSPYWVLLILHAPLILIGGRRKETGDGRDRPGAEST
jgi:hypothetical protein